MISRRVLILGLCALTGCAGAPGTSVDVSKTPAKTVFDPPLYPNETPQLRRQINHWADHYDLPRGLVHRLAIRESTHRPWARNGPYYGLFQILPQTARTMGFEGKPDDLLDAETNLKYALKYLRGAYIVADGNWDETIMWYAKGYYYEAKRKGLLVETGLRAG